MRRVVPSSVVPVPRSRIPPQSSVVIDRPRPRWARRSSRSIAASAWRSSRVGSMTWRRWRPVRCRSVAFNRPASARSVCSPRVRRSPADGSCSTASTITPACSGDTVPSHNATRVDPRSATRRCGVLDGPLAVVAGGAGAVGEPVGGRSPGQLGLRQPAGVDLGEELGLEGSGGGLEPLQLLDPGDQLAGGPRGPQHVAQVGEIVTRSGHDTGGCRERERCDGHTSSNPDPLTTPGPRTPCPQGSWAS